MNFRALRDWSENDGRGGARLRGPKIPDPEAVFGRDMRTLSREPKPAQHSLPGPLTGFGNEFLSVSGGDGRGDDGNRDGECTRP
jgi:hypothetical protein